MGRTTDGYLADKKRDIEDSPNSPHPGVVIEMRDLLGVIKDLIELREYVNHFTLAKTEKSRVTLEEQMVKLANEDGYDKEDFKSI